MRLARLLVQLVLDVLQCPTLHGAHPLALSVLHALWTTPFVTNHVRVEAFLAPTTLEQPSPPIFEIDASYQFANVKASHVAAYKSEKRSGRNVCWLILQPEESETQHSVPEMVPLSQIVS